MKLEGRMTLVAQQISLRTSMELEETPLMDLSQRVIGRAPSLDDDDDDGYWSSLDSLDVDQISPLNKESDLSDG
ncbi:hypothetical protein LIER_37495 [Lithospermum erythrorhizon]|uniref:Uncharacterized protein n=1 Tax=Lithospermum erythrorhizon TaxID=34254 RepID=A0AAV3PQH7_LITER